MIDEYMNRLDELDFVYVMQILSLSILSALMMFEIEVCSGCYLYPKYLTINQSRLHSVYAQAQKIEGTVDTFINDFSLNCFINFVILDFTRFALRYF